MSEIRRGEGRRDDTAAGAMALLAIGAGVVGSIAMLRALGRSRRAINLRGKNVLITGGSRGLGLILARQLVTKEARVAICARDAEEVRRAEMDLRSAVPGAVVASSICDLTDAEQVRRFVKESEERLGPPDAVIHNAGTIQVGPMDTMTEADFEEAMRLHFWAAYHLVQAVLPSMRTRRAGRIALISSIGGKVSVPHLLPYSTSKFALVGYSEGLRAELYREGIYVTTVCPGLIRTGSPRNALFKGRNEKEYTWFAVSDSLPGISMSAEDAASEIIDGLVHGDAEVITSLTANGLAWLHGLMPGATTDLLGEVNRFLPGPGGIGTGRKFGRESQTKIAPSILTALTERSAERNNEGVDAEPDEK